MNLFLYVLRHSMKQMIVLVALIAASALGAQAQVVFSSPKNISNTSADSTNDQIVVDSRGNINVVWLDRTTPTSPYSYTVFFGRSSDGGATFSAPLSVSHPGSSASFAGIAVAPSGIIYILWSDNSPGYYVEFFTRSADDGATFSTPQLISNAGANVGGGKMVVDSHGNIDIVWNDNSPSYYAVFFSHSTDGGASFSSPVNVSNNPLGAGGPDMNVDSAGNVYLAWVAQASFVFGGVTYQGNAVFFSGSADGGATFSSPTDISGNNGPRAFITILQVAAGSMTNISVLWQASSGIPPTDAEYSYSINGGATFQTTQVGSGCEYFPDPHMALDSLGAANVVMQTSCGNTSAFITYARYAGGVRAGGNGWSVIGNTPEPKLAVDSSNDIDIFFGGSIVSFTRSNDRGATFSALENAPGVPDTIATDSGGNIYFVWSDYVGPSNRNIFFSRSVALASLALNPADVTGGSSSTGTATLNGPAPTGGAVVSLSSSDPSVTVPATVTIPEGTVSTTFPVTTSPVAAATTATVSAVFSGVTQTAAITVEPPVLTSLTLNPSSVAGGTSSTGTVTLSGPAPAGGAVVALSSSNSSVATVPSSVTVSPGFTNATFSVSTSLALCSSTATISASFSAVTLTSNLTVLPLVTLPPQTCTVLGAHGSITIGKPHQRMKQSRIKY